MVISLRVEGYFKLLKASIPFAFSRFGDGEWNCILGIVGENCDKHVYFPELGNALSQVLLNYRITDYDNFYFLGLLAISREAGQDKIDAFLSRRESPIPWVSGDVFVNAALAGNLAPFFELLRQRRTMLVGPPHLKDLPKIVRLKNWIFQEIPLLNCWLKKDFIIESIEAEIKNNGIEIVCFSAGMATKVMIDELWGLGVTLIDCGSLFDPFVGVRTRTWHDSLNDNLIERNIK